MNLFKYSPPKFSFKNINLQKYIITPYRIKSFICWHVPFIPIERFYRMFHTDNIFTIENNVKMYLPCERDYIQAEIVIHKRFFENEELAKIHEFITPKMTFLDIGANIGNHTIYFASVLGAKRVYSFEPMSLTASIFKKNIKLNQLEDAATLFECGLGKDNTKAKVMFDGTAVNNLGGTALSECEDGTIEIRRLDDLNIQDKIDFIKIDVERMEASVLLGAKNTILRDHPLMWVEIFEDKYENVIRILHNLGYELKTELSKDNYLFAFRGVA